MPDTPLGQTHRASEPEDGPRYEPKVRQGICRHCVGLHDARRLIFGSGARWLLRSGVLFYVALIAILLAAVEEILRLSGPFSNGWPHGVDQLSRAIL